MRVAVQWLTNNQFVAKNEWTLWIEPALPPKVDSLELCTILRLMRRLSPPVDYLVNRSHGPTPPVIRPLLWPEPLIPRFGIGSMRWQSLDAAQWECWFFSNLRALFLRGGPIVNRASFEDAGTSDMVEHLQAFDLGGPVMTNLSIIDEVEPFVLLWDNHDIKEYRLHACSWERMLERDDSLSAHCKRTPREVQQLKPF